MVFYYAFIVIGMNYEVTRWLSMLISCKILHILYKKIRGGCLFGHERRGCWMDSCRLW